MPSILMRVRLFLSSYFPLFLIVGALFFPKNVWLAGGVVLVGLLSLVEGWRYLRYCQRKHQRSFAKVKDYQRRDNEAMTYIASYIVPFATFNLDLGPQIFALCVFVGVLLIIYVSSNMIYVNPMLNLFGFHLYEVTLEQSDHSYYYVTRKRLKREDTIRYVYVSDEVLLEEK
jgi:hypothetical protein